MMEEYIAISLLNDFYFCPYSIYLHNVYKGSDETLYHDTPQVRGKAAHSSIDNGKYSTRKEIITSLPVFSDELGVYGKIDIYNSVTNTLTERKYLIRTAYRGQMYQLWSQYYCMKEMGYEIEKLSFYSMSTNTTLLVKCPHEEEHDELVSFINNIRYFNPASALLVNVNKCKSCIYHAICDKSI